MSELTQEPTPVQNKFKFDGTEYKFAVDTNAEQGSQNFITSGAVFNAAINLQDRFTQQISQSNMLIPTSDAVWNEYKDAAHYDATARGLYYNADGGTGNKTFMSSVAYSDSERLSYISHTGNGTKKQIPVVYFDANAKRLYYYNGTTKTYINLSGVTITTSTL